MEKNKDISVLRWDKDNDCLGGIMKFYLEEIDKRKMDSVIKVLKEYLENLQKKGIAEDYKIDITKERYPKLLYKNIKFKKEKQNVRK